MMFGVDLARACACRPSGHVLLGVLLWLLACSGAWGQGCPAGWATGEGVPGVRGRVSALAVLPDGDVIVGGEFTVAGNVAANNIARYRPSTRAWRPLGTGTSGSVNSLTVLPGGEVIVRGTFASAGGVAVNNIARYNTVSDEWSAFGSHFVVEGRIFALAALPDGDVVVGGEFATAGGVAANNIARYDPATDTWSALGSGTNAYISHVATTPGGLVVVGGGFTSAGGVPAFGLAQFNIDTGAWSALSHNVSAGDSWIVELAATPDGDVLVGVEFYSGDNLTTRVTRYTPATGTWMNVGNGPGPEIRALVGAVGGDVFTVGVVPSPPGPFSNAVLCHYSASTSRWTYLRGQGSISSASALAALPGGEVIVGGFFDGFGGLNTNNIIRYRPTTGAWSALSEGTNGSVSAIQVLPGGDVIVGGSFTTIGGVAANHIARYTPRNDTWSPLGSGTDGAVYSLAVGTGGDVIVCGVFSHAGGLNAWGVARYRPDTGSWSSVGSGTEDVRGYAVASLPGGDVIVGAENILFDDQMPFRSAARYSVTAGGWAALDVGDFEQTVNALAVLPGDDVIVGGWFFRAGGQDVRKIARYSPATDTWSALGAGVDGNYYVPRVSALAVLPGGDVIVGGTFTMAGGVPANYIARYSPGTGMWSPLGLGTNDPVSALAVTPTGDVIVGGHFDTAGGVPARRIARYSPATDTWSALGSGTNDGIGALAMLPNGDVVAGGWFTIAGSHVSAGFARYRLANSCPADMDCSGHLEPQDIFDFLNAWFTADVPGNFNGTDGITAQDIFDFLAAWFAGC